MSKALSVDLRERVVAAVAAGASCRAAAIRIGVSASSAIRWCARSREVGTVAPGPLGGDRRPARIEAHASLILDLIEQKPDITLAEIRAELARAGVPASIAAVWRFFDRHRITRKKDGTRGRAGSEALLRTRSSSRHPEAPLGVVREPARPRPRPPGVHRRFKALP